MYDLGQAFIDVVQEWGWLAMLVVGLLTVLAAWEVFSQWHDTDNDDQDK